MRIVLLTCCIALLAGCTNEVARPMEKTGDPKKGRYAGILSRCRFITIDTFRVQCDGSISDTFGKADTYRYIGAELDSAENLLFPPDFAPGPANNYSGIYVCYAFAIDGNHTGILARTPSAEQMSSIRLFTLNNMRDTLTDFIELAELWDKAAEKSETISWLFRDNERKLHAYTWLHSTYDHGTKDENDTTIDEYNYHYLVDLSKPKYDTISSNAGNLLKAFQAADARHGPN